MGMYTEIYVNCGLIEKLPKDVIDVLQYLFGEEGQRANEPIKLPKHKFFSDSVDWRHIGNSCSYYHIPNVVNSFRMDEENKCYYLTSRSDLKDYRNEIDLFFDWLNPYIDSFPGEFIGYKLYEDTDLPTLFVKKEDV
jgi:hypothetical protein